MPLKLGALLHDVLLDVGHIVQRTHVGILVVCQDEKDVRTIVSRCGGESEQAHGTRHAQGSFHLHCRQLIVYYDIKVDCFGMRLRHIDILSTSACHGCSQPSQRRSISPYLAPSFKAQPRAIVVMKLHNWKYQGDLSRDSFMDSTLRLRHFSLEYLVANVIGCITVAYPHVSVFGMIPT
jgi:hypothetical protein